MPNFSQKYREIYLEAADRADREQWEYVEESAIRAVLEEIGYTDLVGQLETGELSDTDGWLRNDVSDLGEDPRPRWYYPSGDEPRPDEFRQFHDLLTDAAPDGYEPFYLRVTPAGKGPDTKHGSWKGEEARLTFDEAVERMENGGNVGIAGRGGCIGCGGDGVDNGEECEACDGTGDDPQNEDALVNLDIDDDEETSPTDVPSSLRARSRSRTGWHSWFFDTADEIPNIPTDENGEVRTNWQFVLAPGSFAASTAEGIPNDADTPGYYTVEDAKPVASIEYDDLPSVFHEVAESADEADDQAGGSAASGSHGKLESELSDITVDDLTPPSVSEGDWFSSIFHASKTGQNTSIDGDLLHCWRHTVAHGGLQALATLSNVNHVANYGCRKIGKGHEESGVGPNKLKGDWRLQWGAFHEAKQRGLIADDDPIPHDVLTELAVADGIVDRDDLVERGSDGDSYEALPVAAYNDTLDHVREEYGVDPGRQKKGAMAAPSSTIGTEVEATDGGVAVSNASTDEPSTGDDASSGDLELRPDHVRFTAGLGADDTLADLDDRQKAAAVWSIIRQHDDVHVRCRRDNAALWAYDTDTGTWNDDGERTLRHAAVKALTRQQYGANVLAELKTQARADFQVELEADEFGVDTGTVAVANGLLDLDAAAAGDGSDAIRELRPDDYALARLPVEYEPTAEFGEWSGYVDEWVESGYADALQEFVGYCLHVGSMPIHRALLLVGSGSNGKGTFLHVVRSLLGSDNTSSTELQTLANERDAVADMQGSLANIDDDLSSRGLGSGLGMFKKLVAGDPVRGRRLYEDGFEFEPSTKHLYAANQVPDVQVSDEDEAFWRRWLLVEFTNHYAPAERDSSLRDQLTTDDALAGVLRWAIEGRRRLLDQGHFTGELDLAYDKRRRWQQWGDTVDEFIEDCVEHDSDAERITTGDAYQVYQEWCRRSGDDPVGQRRFTDSVKTEGVGFGKHRIDGTVTNGYTALGFTDEAPDLDAVLADDGDDDETSDSKNQGLDEFDGDDDDDDGGDQAADSGDDGDEVDDPGGDDADAEGGTEADESGDEQADSDDDGARWGSALGTITTKVNTGDEIEPADLADRTDKAELYWSKALEGLADHYDAVERDGSGGYRRAG